MIKRIPLTCPICKKRLIDTTENTESELIPEDKIQGNWLPDYFQKCPKCKNQIGIRKIG